MPIYINNNGASKQIATLPFNYNAQQKILTNAYANINGSQKNIFEATKYSWWKKYNVTSWEMKKSYNNWNSDTEDSSLYGESDWSYPTLYGFSNAEASSNGRILLSDPIKLTWTTNDEEKLSYGTSYTKDVNQTNFFFDYYNDTTSYNHYTSLAYYITSGYYYNMTSNTGTVLEYTKFNIDYNVYCAPTAHSSNHTLIKTKKKSDYSSLVPYIQGGIKNDGTYEFSYYYLNGSSATSGYGHYNEYDDYVDSNGNQNDLKYVSYDGYYWEYLGYYA